MSDSEYSSDEPQDVPRDPTTLKPLNPRRLLFEPVIGRVVDALGGYEAGTYRMGDEANGCLKDLKKLWRKDDTDDERTVARIFWEKRVLSNDLIPILLLTAGAGQVEDKRAISCADLISAMTWPIDMVEELAELDPGERADFTQLHQAHQHYKAAILQPQVMSSLFSLLLPPLAKSPRERSLRDNQVAALVLHIVRNLAAIRDPEGLQSRLLRALQETHIIDLLLTAAANADADPLLAGWNTLVLEIFFLLFRGTPPKALIEQPKVALQRLLAAEARAAPAPTSRHSRFGTTIVVSSKTSAAASAATASATSSRDQGPSARALVHSTAPTPFLLDAGKRPVRARAANATEAALADNLSPEARDVLRQLARSFLKDGVFNPFLTGLLKDIRMERSWATGDRVGMWVLAVVRWVAAFFLVDGTADEGKKREFGHVGAAVESGFVSWVLRRMHDASEEKPKGWATLYAGMGCLTQVLLLLDAISASATGDDDTDADAARTLTTQLIYAGAPLDLALECLRATSVISAAGRGPAFLDAAVHFAYALVRMLERGGEGTYVRRAKKQKKKGGEDDAPDDAEEERRRKQAEKETTFSLEAFEMKFASAEITHALLLQLARFKELETDSEALRRVVSLLHRVAVRAKAEGLFFNVSTLYLFQTILAAQKTFPRDQPHRDLVALVTFVLRRFFKALQEEPFLAVEAFFPKNRGHWKAFSSWEPPEKEKGVRALRAEEKAAQTEVQVKRGYSWSEQLGIVVKALVDADQLDLVNWTIDILGTVIRQWELIANEAIEAGKADAGGDAAPEDDEEDEDVLAKRMAEKLDTPSSEMREKMVDYRIPYTSDREADAASKNPQLKLLFRLAKFILLPEGPDGSEPEWCVGADVPPADLERTRKVIKQFLVTPINLEGKKATELLTKTRRSRRARSPSLSSESGGEFSDNGSGGEAGDGSGKHKKKKKKKGGEEEGRRERAKKKELEYKSAQFIEDSDEEYGDIDAFLEKEKEMRERILRTAEEAGRSAPMKATGTKKRKKKDAPVGEGKRKKKQRKADDEDEDVFGSRPVEEEDPTPPSRPRPKPRFKGGRRSSPETAPETEDAVADSPPQRPRPKPRFKGKVAQVTPETGTLAQMDVDEDAAATVSAGVPEAGSSDEETMRGLSRRRTNRLVVSDDED
ncbi:timeless protein-domain-containing protein [Roridomyces roridus]|uniref:Timeless protein-domain-containing protein n=1 Tax=Roridomyces roridus TaxID=1738132 RepID=A0AAD7B347_9AGAR|nr:timeless protein-domain-containing protein [Roridomyces roridus]